MTTFTIAEAIRASENTVDSLGRKVPRILPLSHYFELALRSRRDGLREIPRSAIVEDGDDPEDGPFAMVRCPCGHRPVARYSIDKCSGCERYYVAVAAKVFVIYGEMDPPPRRASATDASD